MGGLIGGKSSSKSKAKDLTPPEFTGLRGPVAQSLQALVGTGLQQGGGSYNPFDTSRFTAPLTSGEQTGLDQVGNLVFGSGGSNPFDVSKAALTDTVNGNYLTPGSNPFLAAHIDTATRPVIDFYRNHMIPGLTDAATMAGQTTQNRGSSPFVSAVADAQNTAAKQIGDISSTIASQNYDSERNRQVQAATQLPQVSSQQLQQMVQGLQTIALPRLIQQYGVDQGNQEFQNRLTTILNALSLETNAASPHIGNSSSGSSTGGIGQIFGGLKL